MNKTTSTIQDQHHQIQFLLPWYVNQSLRQHEHRLVEQHLSRCLLCRRELNGLRKLADAVTHVSDLDLAAETSFASLRTKLPPRVPNRAPSTSSAKTTILSKFGKFANQTGVRFAMAASLLLAVIPLTLHTLKTNTTDDYYTLSAAKPESANGMALRVVFAKSLSPAEIAAVLAEIHGQRIGEPNSVGALTVRIETNGGSPHLEEAIALLRSRQYVLLAEPLIQP